MPVTNEERKYLPPWVMPAAAVFTTGTVALAAAFLIATGGPAEFSPTKAKSVPLGLLAAEVAIALASASIAIRHHQSLQHRIKAIARSMKEPGDSAVNDDPLFAEVLAASSSVTEDYENKLAAAERRLDKIAPLASSEVLPIAYIDSEGLVRTANDAFLALSGYTIADVRKGGVTRSSLCPPDQLEQSIRMQDALHRYKKAPWTEMELLAKSGDRVPVLASASLLSSGSAESVFIALDLSTLRRTNATLWRRAEIEQHIALLSTRLLSIPCDQIDEVIELGLADFGELFGAHGCATFLVDPDLRQFHKCYEWLSVGLVESREEISLSAAVVHATERLRSGECIHAYRVPKDAGTNGGLAMPEMLCETAVPLLSGGNLAGVLVIQSFRNDGADTAESLTLFRLLAQTIANGVERMCADEALRRSEQTKDAVWHASLDGIIVLDAGGRIVEWNPAAERIFGLSTEAVSGAGLIETIIAGDLQNRLGEEISSVLRADSANSSGVRREIVAQRSNGMRFPCELSIIPIEKQGDVSLFIATVRDITERRKAEERLNASQNALQRAVEQTRVVLDALPARVALFSSDGSILAENRAWANDPEPEWLLPGNAKDPNATSPVLERIVDVASGRDPGFSVEYTSLHAEHGKRWWRVTICTLGPDSRGAVVMHLDITDHQLAVEALADSEERYRSLIENVREAIFTLSSEGELLSANSGAAAIIGYDREALIGRNISDFVRSADEPALKEVFKRVLDGLEPDAFALRVQHADGRPLELECTVVPQYANGSVVGILGVARDVTERNRTEEHARQMERMQSIGQLAAGVAHDFNNILTIQQGYASELAELEQLPVRARDAVGEIAAAGERAALLTRKLLAFGGKQTMQPKVLDLRDFFQGIHHQIEETLGQEVAYTLQSPPVLPGIYLDPEMLHQVISNIISNARDAMPDGGALVVSMDELNISDSAARQNPEARTGHFVRLTITDSGCGIHPEHLLHIFEPFYTTKDVARGAGLGLATVHGIIRQNSGWIEVESRVHSGSSFRIYLPAVAASGVPENQMSQVRPTENNAHSAAAGTDVTTILVVDDEVQLCTVVAHYLRRRGYNVLTAASGADALRLWTEHGDKVDLLLTDLVMPEGMTGKDLADRLLKAKPALKVLYTSGYSSEIAGKDLSLQPGFHFLPKPYQPGVLANAVRDCLSADGPLQTTAA
jgi:PAS domain S-box-containing protein